MKTRILLFMFFVGFAAPHSLLAHSGGHGGGSLRHWHIKNNPHELHASLYMIKDANVYLEDEQHVIHKVLIHDLTQREQAYVHTMDERIRALNQVQIPLRVGFQHNHYSLWLVFVGFFLGLCLLIPVTAKSYSIALHRVFPALIAVVGIMFSFTLHTKEWHKTTTRISFLDSAFMLYAPQVHTLYDANYYYVESQGIPQHPMMTGISNHGWQQQVPIPQCYLGANAWPIPLHPEMASNPIPVDSIHFTRGAIAVAVNGIPIFNVHTNTGVDSYLDGQLDNYGGHCGRADDYHYHTAPLHLVQLNIPELPIALALDGFAVYGNVEPDGSSQMSLDANHGHFGKDGVYHYHGSQNAPYMIARMAGTVTEDSTHQIVPQAAAHPVRPALTPLKGALIQYVKPLASGDGYTLVYTLNNQTDSIVYSWNNSGKYTFTFYVQGSAPSIQTYNGFVPCKMPSAIESISNNQFPGIVAFPNPAHDRVRIQFTHSTNTHAIISTHITDIQGHCLREWNQCPEELDISGFAPGLYVIQLQTLSGFQSLKLQLQ